MAAQAADVLLRLFDAWKSGDVDAYVACFADTFASAHPCTHSDSLLAPPMDDALRLLFISSSRDNPLLWTSAPASQDAGALSSTLTMPNADWLLIDGWWWVSGSIAHSK